jgi:hypothetical protein
MREEARTGLLGIVVAVACSFDTSGAGQSASFGMSLGEAGGESEPDEGASEGSVGSADATQGSADGTGDTGVVDCGADSCIPGAPQGWGGPFAISMSSPPNPDQACAQGWTQHAYAWRELHADPATCICACQPVGGACTINASYYSDAGCSAQVASAQSSGDCKAVYDGDSHGYVRMTGTAVGTGCNPAPVNTVPPFAWDAGVLLCAPPHGQSCAGGACLPALPPGFDARWCISSVGATECTDPYYSQLVLVHQSVDDTRGCTDCTCTQQGAVTCPGSVHQYFEPFCGIPAGGVAVDGACHGSGVSGSDAWSFQYDGTPPTYGCAGSASIAMGDAIATDPMTICCSA